MRNTFTCGKILTENKLETGRKTIQPRLQEKFSHNWVGWEETHWADTSAPRKDLRRRGK